MYLDAFRPARPYPPAVHDAGWSLLPVAVWLDWSQSKVGFPFSSSQENLKFTLFWLFKNCPLACLAHTPSARVSSSIVTDLVCRGLPVSYMLNTQIAFETDVTSAGMNVSNFCAKTSCLELVKPPQNQPENSYSPSFSS